MERGKHETDCHTSTLSFNSLAPVVLKCFVLLMFNDCLQMSFRYERQHERPTEEEGLSTLKMHIFRQFAVWH